jgi:Purine catabolism regulatory protein-like family.
MALTIKQIIEQDLLEGAKLVAGRKGMQNAIAWVNVMEILDSPDSVQQEELLVTTGYQLDREEKHEDLIKRLTERNVSGLAIQPGYYIDKIPEYILEEAEEYNFPILELPANLTFSAIMHALLDHLESTAAAPESDRKNLYSILLSGVHTDKQAAESFEKKYLFITHPVTYSETVKGTSNKGMQSIKSYLFSQAKDDSFYYHTTEDGKAAFFISLKEDTTYQDVVFELTVQLTLLSENQHVDYYVGVSEGLTYEKLETAFAQCMECIHLLERIEAKRGVCPYQNIPFFELFDRIQRNNRSILLGSKALQKLFEYDRFNESQYVYTLRVYLSHEGNASKSAERLFIHRHTLINRMQKIKKICGLDLNDYYTRIYFSLALLVHDFFAL